MAGLLLGVKAGLQFAQKWEGEQMPLPKKLQKFSSNQGKSSQNVATGTLQLMHKDAGTL